MGAIRRFRDIVKSNINSALDRMEDPEKMLNYTLNELEQEVIKSKTSLADARAKLKGAKSKEAELRCTADRWEARAEKAVGAGNEEMAKEALLQKRDVLNMLNACVDEVATLTATVAAREEDLAMLEGKLAEMRSKIGTMSERAVYAKQKIRTEEKIAKSESSKTLRRYEELSQRIDRMEEKANIRNSSSPATEAKFAEIERNEEIEKELEALKNSIKAN